MGRVLRPHSLRGELRVRSFARSGVNLQAGRSVQLGTAQRRILRAREDREAWILKLEGLDSRSQAEPYRGVLLEVPDAELERDSEDSYFVHELIGLTVVLSSGGRELGRLVEVLEPGGNDVYVVRGQDGREYLLPAVGGVIDSVDVRAGVMAITPLPGLLDEPQ